MTDLTVNLTGAAAETLQRLMREGGYASADAALAAVLSDYAATDDADLEHWLREVVAARYDAARADPNRAVDLDAARGELSGRA